MVRRHGETRAPRVTRKPASSARSGFTLLELLIALVLLDIGLLALVATSAAVARSFSGSRGATYALNVATNRIERTLATSCGGSAASALTSTPEITEWWRDGPEANGTRTVTESLVVTRPSASRTVVLNTAGAC